MLWDSTINDYWLKTFAHLGRHLLCWGRFAPLEEGGELLGVMASLHQTERVNCHCLKAENQALRLIRGSLVETGWCLSSCQTALPHTSQPPPPGEGHTHTWACWCQRQLRRVHKPLKTLKAPPDSFLWPSEDWNLLPKEVPEHSHEARVYFNPLDFVFCCLLPHPLTDQDGSRPSVQKPESTDGDNVSFYSYPFFLLLSFPYAFS